MSTKSANLKGKKIVVTGATGFIGSRLAERLTTENEAIVTGVGRNLARVPHLPQLGVTMRWAELADDGVLADIVAGQDIVFHLATAKGSDKPEIVQRINIDAPEKLVREAAAAGVSRFIQVSSMAAYGPPDGPLMDEEHPLGTDQLAPYGRSKARGERRAMEVARECGLELVVVRPGQVYGPRGQSWTINLFELVSRRVPVLFGGGHGHVHPVFVDNLIDGMILCASRPEAVGQAFNFVDQPLTYREFFGYYGAMCGRTPWGIPLSLARVVLTAVKPFLGRTEPVSDLLRFYTNRSVYPSEKAERLLGHRSRVGVEEGMLITEAWLREAGYLSANGRRPMAAG